MSDLIESITALAREGKTAKEIGAVLGCTRNAVLGRLHRAGLSLAELNGYVPPQSRTEPLIRHPEAPACFRGQHFNYRFRVEAVAAALLTSNARAAKALPCSGQAIRNWRTHPKIKKAAEAVANRVRAEQEQARKEAEARSAAERAAADVEREQWNGYIYWRLDPRRAKIARLYAHGATLKCIGESLGVTCERVRQLLEPAKAMGLRVAPECSAKWGHG